MDVYYQYTTTLFNQAPIMGHSVSNLFNYSNVAIEILIHDSLHMFLIFA